MNTKSHVGAGTSVSTNLMYVMASFIAGINLMSYHVVRSPMMYINVTKRVALLSGAVDRP